MDRFYPDQRDSRIFFPLLEPGSVQRVPQFPDLFPVIDDICLARYNEETAFSRRTKIELHDRIGHDFLILLAIAVAHKPNGSLFIDAAGRHRPAAFMLITFRSGAKQTDTDVSSKVLQFANGLFI